MVVEDGFALGEPVIKASRRAVAEEEIFVDERHESSNS
jgi:hypothetical protein